MLDKFDYAEPLCPFCDGEEFYYPKKDSPEGYIPIDRIINKIDNLFDKNNYEEAGRLLEYWRADALELHDKRGELAMESELIGYYRKQNLSDACLKSTQRALELVDELKQYNMASGATIYINCATAYKAFGMPKDALSLYTKAEGIYKSILPQNDPRFGALYNNMALAFEDLERFSDAELAYYKALNIMKNAPNGELECAITYINLAHLYEKCNKLEKTRECLDFAYTMLMNVNNPRNGYFAFVLEKCAPSFAYFGKEDIYSQMIKESKDIYERS